MLNLNTISEEAFHAILSLDRECVGSANYIGVAYFWNREYRHVLRDASTYKRRLIHKRMCQRGLDVRGASTAHEEIIREVMGAEAL